LNFNVIEKGRALHGHGDDCNETGNAEPRGLSSSGCRRAGLGRSSSRV